MRGLVWDEGRQEMHCKLLNVFDSSAWELRGFQAEACAPSPPKKEKEIYCIDNNKILKTFPWKFFFLACLKANVM